MKIDETIEPLVREAFAAVVASEPVRLDSALGAISGAGDEAAGYALRLALAVDRMALLIIHSGERPPEDQLDYLAARLSEDARDWAPSITPTKARAFLAPLAAGTASDLELKDVVLLAYGTGGWLMAAFLPDGKKWTEFLDEIEDALESLEEEPRQ